MESLPDFSSFSRAYEAGTAQIVWTRLVADLETPVSAMVKLGHGIDNIFLFESVEGGAVRGRYSFIGLKPDLIWRCHAGKAEINRNPEQDADAFEPTPEGVLESLGGLIEETRIDTPSGLPPMAAGLFGYMGYDMVRLMERLPDDNPDDLAIPDGIMLRPSVICIFDNIEDVVIIVTPVRPANGIDAESAHDQARMRLQAILDVLAGPLPSQTGSATVDGAVEVTSNTSRAQYHGMVEAAKAYIRAGDVLQVVPSQRFAVPFPLTPFALYRSLRRLNPSPFLFCLDFGGFSVVGSSPEILVRLRDGAVTIRPIAGTRRRGADAAEDKLLADDLLSDPKELAEHLMLLDLGRNDVGRVAKTGTVKVTEQMVIEYYSHVMHIVSNVEGEIKDQLGALEALVAGFPAGTVSGAPKVRAMEIIDELEHSRRGIYGGCIGYFAANGGLDTCIALRTALVKDGTMYVQAGGGIVADSDPEAEYQESRNKAQALISAAEQAMETAKGAG